MPQKRVKIPENIVELKNAHMQRVTNRTHTCYVALPIDAHPQPCLVVVKSRAGTETWFDALVVVPIDAPRSSPIANRTYATALGIIGAAYKGITAQALKNKKAGKGVFDFSSASCNELPFSRTRRNSAKRETSDWSPLQLRAGVVDIARKQYFSILQAWPAWEANKLSLDKRAEAFYKRFPYEPKSDRLTSLLIQRSKFEPTPDGKPDDVIFYPEEPDDIQECKGVPDEFPSQGKGKFLPKDILYDHSQASAREMRILDEEIKQTEQELRLGSFRQKLVYLQLPTTAEELTGEPPEKRLFGERRRRKANR